MNAYQKYLDGDDSALTELLGEYRSPLIFYINRFVGNVGTAEELADDTFFKLIVKKPPYGMITAGSRTAETDSFSMGST